jgi:signal transduction histidine kinase
MTSVAVGLTLLLLVFYMSKYFLDIPTLREAVLKEEAQDLAEALAAGQSPATWPRYKDYPNNYAYRIFDHRALEQRKILSEANAHLLPREPASAADLSTGAGNGLFEPRLLEQGMTEDARTDRWTLLEHFESGDHGYWVQVAMIGDPNGQWREILAQEAIDHVLVPFGFIVPPLTLAMFLVVRQTLRPMRRIADQARALGSAAAAGQPLKPLQDNGLPEEIQSFVLAINAMLAKLQQALERQKQFTSDAAHELRTPLAVLLLAVNQLPRSPEVERVRAEIEALAAQVNQLLRLAQAEGLVASELNPVDLSAAVRKVCEDMAAIAAARSLSVEFDAPEGRVMVNGQAELLDVAARNLIDNALRYAPLKTPVNVTVGEDGWLIVEDRGPGVPRRDQTRIFDRLWRGDRRSSGAGIGLALVRRIAELHSGEITVENRPGGGARFVLRVPIVAKAPQRASRSYAKSAAAARQAC